MMVDVLFDSPMPDLNYEVIFQQQQAGTYDVYPTVSSTTGFTCTINAAPASDLGFSYFAFERSPDAEDAAAQAVLDLAPAFWYRYGKGITSAAGFVSQWSDQSGNARHLVQATGTNQPTLESDGSITTDGVDNFLKAASFTLVQPTTVYLLFKQLSWTNTDALCDGNTLNSGKIFQNTSTPNLAFHAGTGVGNESRLAVGEWGVAIAVFDGANSLLTTHIGGSTTGNAGANSMSGFTLGAAGSNLLFGHGQFKEVIGFPAAHDAANRLVVIDYLTNVGNL